MGRGHPFLRESSALLSWVCSHRAVLRQGMRQRDWVGLGEPCAEGACLLSMVPPAAQLVRENSTVGATENVSLKPAEAAALSWVCIPVERAVRNPTLEGGRHLGKWRERSSGRRAESPKDLAHGLNSWGPAGSFAGVRWHVMALAKAQEEQPVPRDGAIRVRRHGSPGVGLLWVT